jgi:hypothetical protein
VGDMIFQALRPSTLSLPFYTYVHLLNAAAVKVLWRIHNHSGTLKNAEKSSIAYLPEQRLTR